jgi:hypothetical protein
VAAFVSSDGDAAESAVGEGGFGAAARPDSVKSRHRVIVGIAPSPFVKILETRLLAIDGKVHHNTATVKVLSGTGTVVMGQPLDAEAGGCDIPGGECHYESWLVHGICLLFDMLVSSMSIGMMK